jgi:hypothetical protein
MAQLKQMNRTFGSPIFSDYQVIRMSNIASFGEYLLCGAEERFGSTHDICSYDAQDGAI